MSSIARLREPESQPVPLRFKQNRFREEEGLRSRKPPPFTTGKTKRPDRQIFYSVIKDICGFVMRWALFPRLWSPSQVANIGGGTLV